MKYFSLSFRLQKEDYAAYYKDFRKAQIVNLIKKSVFMAIFSMIILFTFVTADTLSYVIPVVSVFLVSVLFPYFYSKKISTSFYKSKQGRKEAIYDFYGDHIEIHINADENCRQTTEKHLKMNGFVSVAESEKCFYFSYMNARVLIIPKRVLDGEKYGMIKNLIDNYFSNVYMAV